MNHELPKIEQAPPVTLEVHEILETFSSKELVSLEDDKVSHYFVKNTLSEGTTEFFTLPTEIDALHYSFDLVSVYGMHELSFTTKEYGYASTNLSDEGQIQLEEALGKLVHSVLAKYPLKELYIKPAPEPATVRDIEDCIEEILLKRRYLTREGLLQEYKERGWGHLFAYYQDLVGHPFHPTDASHDRTPARSRLFKMGLKRLLPDWEISEIANKWTLRKKSLQ